MKKKNFISKKGLLRNRLKHKVKWTPDRLRFCLTKTNMFLYWQLIDDTEWKTVYWLRVKKWSEWVEEMWKKFWEKFKWQKISFDRNWNLYHWVVKKCAESLRKAWLVF